MTSQQVKRFFGLLGLTLSSYAAGAITTHLANAEADTQTPYSVLQQLARALVLAENEYVEPIERARLLDGAISGMVSELDPHSSYLPRDEFNRLRADTEGAFGGIGVEVDFGDDAVTVIAPIEGSPAAEAGILPGDQIVSIDGERLNSASPNRLVQRLRGRPGTKVVMSVKRRGQSAPLEFELVRRIIEVASVSGRLLVDKIAYLRIKQFQRGTSEELLSTLGDLRKQSPVELSGVILDLRNNPGGLVAEAAAVANEFLDEGTIYTTRGRGRVLDEVSADSGGALRTEPCVVLVNEFSASASELVAGALQDNRRATVVGARTFGKGSVQTIFPLPNDAALRLTTMRYYTPRGHSIQAQGIQPDVFVEASYVRDGSFTTLREADLPNHLPPEQSAAKPTSKIAPSGRNVEEPGVSPTHLGVARVVPRDPTGGPDFALSIGFQVLRGILAAPK